MKRLIDHQIENVEELVSQNVISPKFAAVLIAYLIKKDVHKEIRESISDFVRYPKEKQQKFALDYSRKHTSF